MGDAESDYNHTVEFGYLPIVVVPNMDIGCSLTFNVGSPIETVVTTINGADYMVQVQAAKTEGGGDLSPLMSGAFPLKLWTGLYNVKCHCTPGSHANIVELKRN